MPDLSKWGPVTVLLVALAIIVAAGGLVVVIVQPDTLTFAQYLDDLKTFAVALGVLGVGRGIHLGLGGDTAPVTDSAQLPPSSAVQAAVAETVKATARKRPSRAKANQDIPAQP